MNSGGYRVSVSLNNNTATATGRVLQQHAKRPFLAVVTRMEALVMSVALPALLAQYALVFMAATSAHTRMPECLPVQLGGYDEAYRAWDAGVCFTEEQLWCASAAAGEHAHTHHNSLASCRGCRTTNAYARFRGSFTLSPPLARWRRCRVHPGRHAACTTADCRAEEVRLSLPGRDGGAGSGAGLGDYFAALAPDDSLREPVWGGCSASQVGKAARGSLWFLTLEPGPLPAGVPQVNSIWSRFEAAGAWRGACVPFGDKRSTLLRHCGPEQALADGEFFWPVADLREVGERDPERNCTTEHGASANGWSCSRL